MELYEKTIEQKYPFKGRLINLRQDKAELPDGTIVNREVVEHSGGVCIAALTKDNKMFFVEQFRYPYGKVILELPAGKIDKGEDPLETGKRELKEETGVTAGRYESLGVMYPTTGYCDEVIHIYFADSLEIGKQKLDDGEYLNVKTLDLEKAVEMILKGEIVDAKTQIAVMKVAMLKKLGKI